MSWHFLQEQEAAYWDPDSSDGIPSALSRLIPSAGASCSLGSETARSPSSPSGMTSGHLTAAPGAGESTSSQPGFHASHSAQRVEVESLLKTSGPMLRGSLPKSNPRTSSLRTSSANRSSVRPRTFSDSVTFVTLSELLPPAWVPRIGEFDTGYLPTITTRNNQQSPSMLKWPAYQRLAELAGGQKLPAAFWEWMMGWPIGWTDFEPLATDKFQQWWDAYGSRNES